MTGESGGRRCGWLRGLRGHLLWRSSAFQANGDPTVLGPIGIVCVGCQWVTLTVEAHGDLRFLNAIGLEEFHDRQGPAPRQLTVGQAVAAVVGVAIEVDAIDRRVGLEELQNDVQLGLAQVIQGNTIGNGVSSPGSRRSIMPESLRIGFCSPQTALAPS